MPSIVRSCIGSRQSSISWNRKSVPAARPQLLTANNSSDCFAVACPLFGKDQEQRERGKGQPNPGRKRPSSVSISPCTNRRTKSSSEIDRTHVEAVETALIFGVDHEDRALTQDEIGRATAVNQVSCDDEERD